MKRIISLNDGWIFQKEEKAENVSIPHTWNAVDGQEQSDYYRGKCSYTKVLPDTHGKTYIEFGAVNSVAVVYVNNVKVGTHKGGYSLFRFDITNYLTHGKNTLMVEVDNSDRADIYPSMADFTFYGGIYRDVNLITDIPDCCFSLSYGLCGIHATPVLKDKNGIVKLKSVIDGNYSNVSINYFLVNQEKEIVSQTKCSAADSEAIIEIDNPILWNGVKNPYLYTIRAELIQNDNIVDTQSFKIGFRTITFDSEKGCLLNGVQIKLKGVSRHQDRYHLGNALTEKEHREDLELIKEVGANSIRLAHYQHDQKFYDICDEMGFLVWAEVPVISKFSQKKQENAKQQLRELIEQNYNHASIFCWGIENEITMGGNSKKQADGIKELNALAHSLDKSRLTTAAQFMMGKTNSPLNEITDILGYNLYFGWYSHTFNEIDRWLERFHKENPTIKLCLSEYGAEGIIKYQNDVGVQGDYSETYQAKFHEHYLRAINNCEWLWGSYVWNMFDFGAADRNEGGVKGRNNKGLVTLDRKTRKDSFYVYKAFWSDEKFVHIAGERYIERPIGKTRIIVYSNLDEITIKVNEQIITKPCDKIVVFENVDLPLGEVKIVAYNGQYEDELVLIGVQEPNPNYSMPKGTSTLVRNWFENDSGEIRSGYYSVNDTVGTLMSNEEISSLVNNKIGKNKVLKLLINVIKPFKLKTLMKLIKMDAGMEVSANGFLQTVKKD